MLRETVAAGVNHIETSDYSGPHVINRIIKKAVHDNVRNLGLDALAAQGIA